MQPLQTSFDQALALAEGIANRKKADLTALTLYPIPRPHWTAYFSVEGQGGSFVDCEEGTSFARHLDDYEEHWYERGEDDE